MENYDNWKEEYYGKEKVDLKKYFSANDFEIIKKLGIEVLGKIYTESEFENLYNSIIAFCDEEDLASTGVGQEEYDSLLTKLDKINQDNNF